MRVRAVHLPGHTAGHCVLLVEPHGIARLWSTGKEKLRLWPFPH